MTTPLSTFQVTPPPGWTGPGGGRISATLRPDRLELALGGGGLLAVMFAFPQLGRPHFPPAATAAQPVTVLGPHALQALAVGLPEGSAELLRSALTGRLALVATGDPTDVVPL